MKLIRPTTLTDASVTSSTVPETEHAAWSAATTYAIGDRRIKGHRIWESVQATNLNHDPEVSGAAWWTNVGPTNQRAMFDNTLGTATSAAETLTVVLAPGRVDALALLQVEAASATVTMTVGAETVYSQSLSLIDDSGISDWYAYFTEPILPKDYVVLTDLPVFGEGQVTITLSKPAGTVSCGMCVVGLKAEIGGVQKSPALGINDFSRKEVDAFGTPTLVKRGFSKRLGVKLVFPSYEVDRVHSILSSIRATPIVWIGSEKYSAMMVFGFYRDFEVDIAYATLSYCTLNIEGMI